ncbi:hypothetical protein V5O48_019650, partial [Marasmius crinis-equi]
MIVFLFTNVNAGFSFVFNALGRIYTITIILNTIILKQHGGSQKSSATSWTRSRSRIPRRSMPSASRSVVFAPIEFQTFTIPDHDIDDLDTTQPTKASAAGISMDNIDESSS